MTTAEDFYGVTLDGLSSPASTSELIDVFHILKPKPSQTPLVRIGGNADGAYLVPDDVDGITACFSPGVNRIKYFEDYLADRYGIPSHMCDFTCDVADFTTPLKPALQTFTKKWLDVTRGDDNISLEDWIVAHDPPGDLLLQMDIEGAEYRNLLGTPDEILARFRIIVLEVHGLGRMLDARVLRQVLAPFFAKLDATFTTVHAHPNNCCGDVALPQCDVRIPNVLELTMMRTDRFIPAAGPVALPHPLDVSRNVPRKAPLVLSDAWCDYQRPLESRVKIIEDALGYRDDPAVGPADRELAAALSLTMQSIQSLATLTAPASPAGRHDGLTEVARGRPFRLSSVYGSTPAEGVVRSSDTYFFHTGFGTGQWIDVDLGREHRIGRIEITNRRDGYQERSRFIFARLSTGRQVEGALVFPLYTDGQMKDGAWRECAIELPYALARYVAIIAPMKTALHFADLRVYAVASDHTDTGDRGRAAPLHRVQSRLRRVMGMR